MAHAQTYPGRGHSAPDYRGALHLCALTAEQRAHTCRYWYTVTDNSTAHTAFRTRAALMRWLADRRLTLTAELPAELGEHAVQRIAGTYRTAMHTAQAEFFALRGDIGREMSNGEYTMAIYTADDDGIVTVHTLNPNVHTRPVYDWGISDAMKDGGE